jgi:hypothetical protein
MRKALKILLTLVAVVGLGWVLVANLAVRPVSTDLAAVGQGTPAVVLAFENYSPAGLDSLERLKEIRGGYEDRVLFRVADLGTPAGRGFATRHGLENGMIALVGPDGAPVHRTYVPGTAERLRAVLDARLTDLGLAGG